MLLLIDEKIEPYNKNSASSAKRKFIMLIIAMMPATMKTMMIAIMRNLTLERLMIILQDLIMLMMITMIT